MKAFRPWFSTILLVTVIACCCHPALIAQERKPANVSKPAEDQKSSEQAAEKLAGQLTTAFNAGKADEIAGLFVDKGELIDEEGNTYQGHDEIKKLLTTYFEKFPGAITKIVTDSVRHVGPVSIIEGNRTTTTKEHEPAQVRFILIAANADSGLKIVSLRDFADSVDTAAPQHLAPLDFLIGDWVNEGADARVKISYKWTEDKKFIVGEFHVIAEGKTASKSTQRIGWDPVLSKVRSWTFDSDGGFAEAVWTQVETGWVLDSSAVLPDGQTGSAVITITAAENGRFKMVGTNRVVGNVLEDDFEFIITRQPPTADK